VAEARAIESFTGGFNEPGGSMACLPSRRNRALRRTVRRKVDRLEPRGGRRQTRGLGTLRAADRTHPRVCVSMSYRCTIGIDPYARLSSTAGPSSFLPSIPRPFIGPPRRHVAPYASLLSLSRLPGERPDPSRLGRGSITVSAFGIFGWQAREFSR